MSIRVSSVTKSFGAHKALDAVSLEIGDGEFFVVLGPSGCGKSTLLRTIAGLEAVDSGEIALEGNLVAGPHLNQPPEKRQVGVVFQSYALWPHMTVAGNVAFPMESAGLPKRLVEAHTADYLRTVELSAYSARRPAELSGGQRQRVALARCLAQSARTILMDEPLANLDPHLRAAMEEELATFHATSGATTLFITHDQREAMALADRMAVMWEGQILQADTPESLYTRPVNARVAGFVGRSTILDVEVTAVDGGRAQVFLAGKSFEVSCPEGTKAGAAELVIRPEQVSVGGHGEGLNAAVERVTYRGGLYEVHGAVVGLDRPLLFALPNRVSVGEAMTLGLKDGWLLAG